MAIAGILIWRKMPRGKAFTAVAVVFFVNLGLNVLWSYLFFSAHLIDIAFFETLVLALSILVIIMLAWKHAKAAAIMIIPYFLWVCFASYLTYTVWSLNR